MTSKITPKQILNTQSLMYDATNEPAILPIITGINLDGTIVGIRIFDNDETPGIGTKIMEADFMDSFIGKNTVDDVEMISGSTVSAEGVVYGVEGAIEAFNNFLVE